MNMKKYNVVLMKDRESGWFVAEVPNLPGCFSQGKTRTEALENIKDAIEGYLESVRKHPEENVFAQASEVVAVSVLAPSA